MKVEAPQKINQTLFEDVKCKLLNLAARNRATAVKVLSEFGVQKLVEIENNDDLELVGMLIDDEIIKPQEN